MNKRQDNRIPQPAQAPLTRKDWLKAMIIFAAMGLAGCGLMDDLSDTVDAQAQRITGDDEPDCSMTYTVGPKSGTLDTATVCEASK
ncbi:MAG: hypothetical protein ABI036_14160 [Fibrobacteria bacterium]